MEGTFPIYEAERFMSAYLPFVPSCKDVEAYMKTLLLVKFLSKTADDGPLDVLATSTRTLITKKDLNVEDPSAVMSLHCFTQYQDPKNVMVQNEAEIYQELDRAAEVVERYHVEGRRRNTFRFQRCPDA